MPITPKKNQYAWRAIFELAKHEGKGPKKISEIAEVQSIPLRFLEVILSQLKGSAWWIPNVVFTAVITSRVVRIKLPSEMSCGLWTRQPNRIIARLVCQKATAPSKATARFLICGIASMTLFLKYMTVHRFRI